MKPTDSMDHWPAWFNDQSSPSHNMIPQESSSPQQHSSQPTVHHQTDMTLNSPDLRQQQQNSNNDTVHITSVPHYIDPNDDHDQQEDIGTSRSGWRWSTWSAANSWITSRNRKLATDVSTAQGTSSKPPVPPPSSSTANKRVHQWLDRHKRRTFPPSARRVLKLEQRRLTHGSGMKKKHRFGGSSNRKQQKQRDQFFQHPQRRRHSLSGILTSFVQSPTGNTSSYGSGQASNSGGSGGSGGGHSSRGNTSSSGGGGGGGEHSSSSSSSGFFRGGLPFFTSHPSSNSSRKSTAKPTPTVRSSMVLHFTEDDDNADIASMHIPDVFYLDNDDGDAVVGGDSPHGSGATDNDKSISSIQRQKQRQPGPSQENGNWFSNWIMHHPRRKQKQSQKQTPKWLRGNQAIILTSNSNGSNTKVHPSPSPPSTTTTDNTSSTPRLLNNNNSNSSNNNNTNNNNNNNNTDTGDEGDKGDEKTGKQKHTGKKRALPLIRYATLSDLSSLSSSNPSHLMKSSATIESMSSGRYPPQKHQHHLLPLYHHHHDPSATKQTHASYRFSAFWKSHSGKTGKQIIHVDEQGQAGHATLWRSWETCHHETAGNILASLFILGFLVCPSWWLGAILYLSRSSYFDTDLQSVHLWTPRTFGHLNCWMSVVSLLLVGLMGSLAIWYHFSTT